MILTKKIRKPDITTNLVNRSELIESLSDSKASKILLLNAPAGYGKTTLLNQLSRHHQERFTWYSLDSSDNDSKIFWSYFIQGLREIDPVIGKKSLALIHSDSQGDQHEGVLHLLADLDRFQTRYLFNESIYLIFDDFHYLTDPLLIEQFNFFVDYLPLNFKLWISCRSQPSLNISRRISRGDVYVVPPQDLLLSPKQVTDFFSISKGWLVTGLVLDAIYNISGGWLGMLQILSVSNRLKSADEFSKIETLSDGKLMLSEYIQEEIISGLSKDELVFIYVLGMFSEINESSLSEILPDSAFQNCLSKLLDGNLVKEKLAYGERRYSLNESLKLYLKENEELKLEQKLHERIEQHMYSSQDNTSLFDYGVRTKNWPLAMTGCVEVLQDLIRSGQYHLGRVYVDQFPVDISNRYPALRLFSIWMSLYESGHDQANAYLDEVEGFVSILERSDRKEWGSLGIINEEHYQTVTRMCFLTLFQVRLLSYGMVDSEELTNKIYHQAIENGDFGQWSWNGLGANAFMQGRMRLAEEYLFKAVYHSKKNSDAFCLLSSLGCLGPCLMFLGKPEQALTLCDEIQDWCVHNGFDVTGQFSILHRVRLLVYREINNHEQADLNYELLKQCARYIDPLNRIYHYWAEVLYKLGVDNKACRQTLNRLQTHFNQHYRVWNLGIPSPDLIHSVLDVIEGDPTNIVAWAKSFDKNWGAEKNTHQQFSFELLVYSRVLLATGKNPEAPLRYIVESAIEEGNMYLELKAKTLLSCYGLQNKKTSGYIELLVETLLKAERHKLIRAILDEQEFILDALTKPLLKRVAAHTELQKSDLWNLVVGIPTEERRAGEPGNLTKRERQVFDYLLDGRTNEEIGQFLGISKTTVKTHVMNIYGKYQVNSRIQLIKLMNAKVS